MLYPGVFRQLEGARGAPGHVEPEGLVGREAQWEGAGGLPLELLAEGPPTPAAFSVRTSPRLGDCGMPGSWGVQLNAPRGQPAQLLSE